MQLVPHLGRDAQHLYVFQRTPSSVDVRGNKPTDPKWAASLQPGWQEERKRNFHRWSPLGGGVVFDQPDMVCDFWTELGRNMTARIAAMEDPASLSIEQITAIHEEEDYKVMERLRRHVEAVVDNPDTAEALKPYYRHLQAADLQRRVFADVQSAKRDASRRVGVQGRRTVNRKGPGRQRR